MTVISRNSLPRLPDAKASDPRSKLEQLYKTLQELRKQLRSLHKQLESAGTIGERMALRRQITAVEEMVEAIRRQIMLITQAEKRKQGVRLEVPALDASLTGLEPADSQDSAVTIYKPPYELGE